MTVEKGVLCFKTLSNRPLSCLSPWAWRRLLPSPYRRTRCSIASTESHGQVRLVQVNWQQHNVHTRISGSSH